MKNKVLNTKHTRLIAKDVRRSINKGVEANSDEAARRAVARARSTIETIEGTLFWFKWLPTIGFLFAAGAVWLALVDPSWQVALYASQALLWFAFPITMKRRIARFQQSIEANTKRLATKAESDTTD